MDNIKKEEFYILPMVAVKGFLSRIGELTVILMDKFCLQHFAPMQFFPNEFRGCEGKVFDVKITPSGYVLQVFPTNIKVQDLFETTYGYVDFLDDRHGHYHIFDNKSRHFVAYRDSTEYLHSGDFVEFCPLIPKDSKFKSAIVVRRLSFDEGLSKFGTFDIEIIEVFHETSTFKYSILSKLPELEEGWFRQVAVSYASGYIISKLHIGLRLQAVLFLKRSNSDREKTNYVAKLLGLEEM